MHPSTIKKILTDEENIDVAKLAEATIEDKKREVKQNHVSSMARSRIAYAKKIKREQEEISFRQKLSKVWKNLNGT